MNDTHVHPKTRCWRRRRYQDCAPFYSRDWRISPVYDPNYIGPHEDSHYHGGHQFPNQVRYEEFDLQDGELDALSQIFSAVPGVKEAIYDHPILSSVLAGSWLTASFYACKKTAGFVAVLVQLVCLAGLTLDHQAVYDFVTSTELWIDTRRRFAPEILSASGERVREFELQDDGDSGGFIAGLFGLAKSLSLRGSSLSFHEKRTVADFTTSLRTVRDLIGFVKFVCQVLPEVKNVIWRAVFGPSAEDILTEQIAEFAKLSVNLSTVDPQTLDTERASYLIRLFVLGLDIRSKMMTMPEHVKKTYGPAIHSALVDGKQIFPVLNSYITKIQARVEPVHVCFHGEGDVMKTYVSSYLAANIVRFVHGKKDPSLVFDLNPALKFFDTYRPKTIVARCDDYMQVDSDEQLVAACNFMIAGINVSEYILPMAAVIEKGMRFGALCVLSTTNMDFMPALVKGDGLLLHTRVVRGKPVPKKLPIGDPMAFARRHHFYVHVTIRSQAALNALKHEGPPTDERIDAALKFTIQYRPKIDKKNMCNIEVKIADLMQMVEDAMNKNVADSGRLGGGIDDMVERRAAKRKVPYGAKPPALVLPLAEELEVLSTVFSDKMTSVKKDVVDKFDSILDRVSKAFGKDGVGADGSSSAPEIPIEFEMMSRTRRVVDDPPKEPFVSKRAKRRRKRLEQNRRKRPLPVAKPPKFLRRTQIDIQDGLFSSVRTFLNIGGAAANAAEVVKPWWYSAVCSFYDKAAYTVRAVWVMVPGSALLWYTSMLQAPWAVAFMLTPPLYYYLWFKSKMSDPVKRRRVYLILGVIALVLVLIAFVMYSRRDDLESQSTDNIERRAPKTIAKQQPVTIPRQDIALQDAIDPCAESLIVSIFAEHLGSVTGYDVGPMGRTTNFLAVGEQLAIIPKHLMNFVFRGSGMASFSLPDNTNTFHVNELRYTSAVEGRDVTFWRNTYFQCGSLREKFMTSKEIVDSISRRAPCSLLTLRHNGDRLIPTIVQMSEPKVSSRGLEDKRYNVKFDGQHIRCKGESIGGDCGGVLIFHDPRIRSGARIAGILFGGFTKKFQRYAVFTTANSETIRPHITPRAKAEPQQVKLQWRDGSLIHPKKRAAVQAATKGVRFHGFVSNGVFQPEKQPIKPSLIAHYLSGTPISHPTRCVNSLKGVEYGLKKMSLLKPSVDPNDIRYKIGRLSEEWPAPYIKEILTAQEAIDGVSDLFIGPLRQASGAGYGFQSVSGKFPFVALNEEDIRKMSPELLETMAQKIEDCVVGDSFHPYADYQKSERVSNSKLDYQNRITNAGQVDTQILMRSLFGPWLDMMRRQCPEGPSMIGFNPYSCHWHLMEENGVYVLRIIAQDGRAWDIVIPRGVIIYVCEEILGWCDLHLDDGLNEIRAELLEKTLIYHIHVILDMVLSRDGLASGNIITTEGNIAINEVVTKMIIYHLLLEKGNDHETICSILKQKELYHMFFYGDDSRIYVSPELEKYVDNVSYARMGKELFGIVFTPSDDKTSSHVKWPDPENTVFLKRRTRKLDNLRIGAFTVEQCVEIARWITDAGPPGEMTRDNCEASLRELALHGEEVFNLWYKRYQSGLQSEKCPALRIKFQDVMDQIYSADAELVKIRSRFAKIAASGKADCTWGYEFVPGVGQSLKAEKGSINTHQEESWKTALERGVRLLKNKGFPVDVQRMLAVIGEKRTCHLLLREGKGQQNQLLAEALVPPPMENDTNNNRVQIELQSTQDLREAQTLPVLNREQTQSTADQSVDVVASEPAKAAVSLYQAASSGLLDQGLKSVLSRPYEILNYSWTGAEASGTTIGEFEFPYDLFRVPQVGDKLEWFSYFRCKGVMLTIRLNLTMFHYGCLMMSGVEGQSTWGVRMHDSTFLQRFNNRPEFISAMASPVTEISYPWNLPWQWFPIIHSAGSDHYTGALNYNTTPLSGLISRVTFDIVQPLGMLGTGVSPGSVTVFANFIDPEVQGPVLAIDPFPTSPPPLVDPRGKKKKKQKIELQSLSEVLSKAGSMINIGKSHEGKHSIDVASIIDEAAGFLTSMDKTIMPMTPTPVAQVGPYSDGPYGLGSVVATKLLLDPSAGLHDQEIYGEGNMSIYQLAQKPGLLDLFTIEGATHQAGELVVSYYVHPNYHVINSSPGREDTVPTYLHWASMPFKWWTGSLKYQFRFFAPKFTTARFRLVWFPSDKALASLPPATLQADDVGNLYSRIIDVTGDTIVNVKIPWLSPAAYRLLYPGTCFEWTASQMASLFIGGTENSIADPTYGHLNLGTSNGVLALYVVNDLSSPTSANAVNITAALFVSAAEDYRLGLYTGIDTVTNPLVIEQGFVIPEPLEIELQSGNVWTDFHVPFDPITPSVGHVELGAVMPEQYGSLGDLVKRTELKSDLTGAEIALYNPKEIDFTTLQLSSMIAYWRMTFVWSRGSFVRRSMQVSGGYPATYNGWNLGTATATTMEPGSAHVYIQGTGATMVYWPFTPTPFWPTAAALLEPSDSPSYWTLYGNTPGDYQWSGAYDDFIATPPISLGDDFVMNGLYSPPVIIRETAEATIMDEVKIKRGKRVRVLRGPASRIGKLLGSRRSERVVRLEKREGELKT
jgi:hypothetical protein